MCPSQEPDCHQTGNQSNVRNEVNDGVSCKWEMGLMMGFPVNGNGMHDRVSCELKMVLMIRTKIAFLNSYVGLHLCQNLLSCSNYHV